MSKFIDNIQAGFTGKYRARPDTVFDLHTDISTLNVPYSNQQEYKIYMTYEVKGYCMPDELGLMLNSYIQSLKREVYGDFVNQLYSIQRYILQRDFYEAKELIQKLINEVTA
jgi:hypothetical protein